MVQGGETQTESGGFPELRRWSYEFERPEQLEFTEESITEERVAWRENLRHLWWVSLELSVQQNVNQHMCVKKSSETRNKHLKILEERGFGTCTGMEECLCLPAR